VHRYQTDYKNQLIQEIKATPDEYLPILLNIVRGFRESVTLKPAEDSFRQGWEEAMNSESMPITDLWSGTNRYDG
jgi:hypothetical protein